MKKRRDYHFRFLKHKNNMNNSRKMKKFGWMDIFLEKYNLTKTEKG